MAVSYGSFDPATKTFSPNTASATNGTSVLNQPNAQGGYTSGVVQNGTIVGTPTVVSDANIREKTIPDITQRATAALSPYVNNNSSGIIQTAAPAGSQQSANGNYVDKNGNQYAQAPQAGAASVTPGAGSSTPSSAATPGTSDTPPANDYESFLQSIFSDNPSTGTQGVAAANDPYFSVLSQMKATSDAGTRTLIDATQKQFEQRKAQLAATQTAQHAGLMQALISNGQAQYAPVLAGQTMTADETAHVLALSSIDAEESAAVAQLQKAQNDQDFQTMGKYLDHLDSLRSEKITVAAKLADSAAAATKAINDAKQHVQDKKDIVLEELAKSNPPADIMAAAAAAPDAAGVISVGHAYFQDPTSTGGQYNAYVQSTLAKGLTPMLPSDWIQKQESNKAYNAAYAGEKGKLAADAESVSISGGIPGPLSGVVNTILASGKFTKDQASAIRNAINNGEDPVVVIKNNAKNIMGQTEATTLTKYETAQKSLQDIQKNLSDFYAAGGKTSFLSGNYEKVINKLGTVNDPKLVELATQIAANLQIYRNAVSGTAYSAQEGADIATIFPGINKTEGLNKAILAGRMKAFDSTVDGQYESTIGKKAYDVIKSVEQNSIDNDGGVPNAEIEVNNFITSNPDLQISGKPVDEFIANMYDQPGATNENIYAWLKSNSYAK